MLIHSIAYNFYFMKYHLLFLIAVLNPILTLVQNDALSAGSNLPGAWVLSQWNNPNLNRASGIQLLDEKAVAENGDLER